MNPKCLKCDKELYIGRQFYLRNVTYFYGCRDCAFTFKQDAIRGFYSEKVLLDEFSKTFYPEYQI